MPMAEILIVSWREIPAQVIVKAGRRTVRRQLPERFEQAIDRAAMRAGLSGSDAYLDEWRRASAGHIETDDLEAAADERALALNDDFTDERLRTLVTSGGLTAVKEGSGAA